MFFEKALNFLLCKETILILVGNLDGNLVAAGSKGRNLVP
jgi:hypothetical protein